MSIFKNKGKQAEGTTKNHNIKNVFGLAYGDNDDRLCNGFDMVSLSNLLDDKETNKADTIKYKSERNKRRKAIASSYDEFHYYHQRQLVGYYSRKYLLSEYNQLVGSDFKYRLDFVIGNVDSDHTEDDRAEHTMFLANAEYHTEIASDYVEKIRRSFYLALDFAYLRGMKNYATGGKYEVKFGELNFADEFDLQGSNDHSVKLTLPHSYKTEVMGSGLEVIDSKYLTVRLKEYASIIVNCAMYHADVLKVVKPFNSSEVEQLHIAKLGDTVLYAKTNQQLTKKVLKHFEEVNELEAVA